MLKIKLVYATVSNPKLHLKSISEFTLQSIFDKTKYLMLENNLEYNYIGNLGN